MHAPSVRWAWSVNAAASVLGSAGAMFIAIYCGLRTTMLWGRSCMCARWRRLRPPHARAPPRRNSMDMPADHGVCRDGPEFVAFPRVHPGQGADCVPWLASRAGGGGDIARCFAGCHRREATGPEE
jgi:hypothetical protein